MDKFCARGALRRTQARNNSENENDNKFWEIKKITRERRIPIRFERHDPVDVGERGGERINYNAGPAECAEFPRCAHGSLSRIGGEGWGEGAVDLVLFGRPAAQPVRHENPDAKDHDSADHESG